MDLLVALEGRDPASRDVVSRRSIDPAYTQRRLDIFDSARAMVGLPAKTMVAILNLLHCQCEAEGRGHVVPEAVSAVLREIERKRNEPHPAGQPPAPEPTHDGGSL